VCIWERFNFKLSVLEIMGKAIWGPSGPITGKVGNLVYYLVNGEQRVRTPGKVTVPPSPAQLRVRMEMSVVAEFLKGMIEILNVGFRPSAKGSRSPYNMATSYNRLNAIKGVYPDISMDFSKVMVSKGNLFGAAGLSVVLENVGLVFSWNGNYPQGYPHPTDQTIVLAYFPEQHRAVYGLYGANRLAGTVLLAIPEDLMAEPMEVYFALVSANRKQVSDSGYLGRVN
jgi:hypothetical protein